jgi:hypothetical protein
MWCFHSEHHWREYLKSKYTDMAAEFVLSNRNRLVIEKTRFILASASNEAIVWSLRHYILMCYVNNSPSQEFMGDMMARTTVFNHLPNEQMN